MAEYNIEFQSACERHWMVNLSKLKISRKRFQSEGHKWKTGRKYTHARTTLNTACIYMYVRISHTRARENMQGGKRDTSHRDSLGNIIM